MIELIETLLGILDAEKHIIPNPYDSNEKIIKPAVYTYFAIGLEQECTKHKAALDMFKTAYNTTSSSELQDYISENCERVKLILPVLFLMYKQVKGANALINDFIQIFSADETIQSALKMNLVATQVATTKDFNEHIKDAISAFEKENSYLLLTLNDIEAIADLIKPQATARLLAENGKLNQDIRNIHCSKINITQDDQELVKLYDATTKAVAKLLTMESPVEQKAQIIQKIRAVVGDIDVTTQDIIIRAVLDKIHTFLPASNLQQLAHIAQHAAALGRAAKDEVIAEQQQLDDKKKKEDATESKKQRSEAEYALAAIIIGIHLNKQNEIDQIIGDAMRAITLSLDTDVLPAAKDAAKLLLQVLNSSDDKIQISEERLKIICALLACTANSDENATAWLKALDEAIQNSKDTSITTQNEQTTQNVQYRALAYVITAICKYLDLFKSYFGGSSKNEHLNEMIEKCEIDTNNSAAIYELLNTIIQINDLIEKNNVAKGSEQSWVQYINVKRAPTCAVTVVV